MKKLLIYSISLFSLTVFAQFPSQVGVLGTTAMYKDSSKFVSWGTHCHVVKGLQDISTPSLGLVTVGDSSMVIGKADGSVVSLGDAGYAIVTFTAPIKDGPGFDFAVFENGFNDTFLELGFVEVSSDGINFFRFPATSNSPTSPQYGNAAVMDATKLDNLAGKYRGLYGTPFDLISMMGIPLLDINNVTHVKIIDVVGSIISTYARYDKNSNIINDPWPTGFASSGFDLDAVGVINQAGVGTNELNNEFSFQLYPNPISSVLGVRSSGLKGEIIKIKILDVLGKEMKRYELNSENSEIDLSDLNSGIYFVTLENEKSHFDRLVVRKKIIKE